MRDKSSVEENSRKQLSLIWKSTKKFTADGELKATWKTTFKSLGCLQNSNKFQKSLRNAQRQKPSSRSLFRNIGQMKYSPYFHLVNIQTDKLGASGSTTPSLSQKIPFTKTCILGLPNIGTFFSHSQFHRHLQENKTGLNFQYINPSTISELHGISQKWTSIALVHQEKTQSDCNAIRT